MFKTLRKNEKLCVFASFLTYKSVICSQYTDSDCTYLFNILRKYRFCNTLYIHVPPKMCYKTVASYFFGRFLREKTNVVLHLFF